MLDRRISNISIQYEHIEIFKNEHASEFSRLRTAIALLENEYQITISDDEIAYILKILLTHN